MKVGTNDRFEREYIGKFKALASRFGEFVSYERDRAARDIGLHLTRPNKDGSEEMSSTLSWFQMKGIRTVRLSKTAYDALSAVDLRLSVRHLKFWYRQPMPTYLVVYIESADQFLVTDIQHYIKQHWGERILTRKEKTLVVSVPKQSVLDDDAFKLILRRGDVSEWERVLGIPKHDAEKCMRDGSLIYQLGTAGERKVKHRAILRKWISKTRSEVIFEERQTGDTEWHVIHQHWQLYLRSDELEATFPYAEFRVGDEEETGSGRAYDDECGEFPPLSLSNDDVVYPVEYAGEYAHFYMRVMLNEKGNILFEHLKKMIDAKLLRITEKANFISVAPWHYRDV